MPDGSDNPVAPELEQDNVPPAPMVQTETVLSSELTPKLAIYA